jgi:hypothetical protein
MASRRHPRGDSLQYETWSELRKTPPSLLLDLGLKHHLIVQRKLAKRVIEAMAVGRRQVSGFKNVNAQASHVVDTLRRVKIHLD